MKDSDLECFFNPPSRQLHKFGGSSLASPEAFLRVASLLEKYGGVTDLIVVSAAGKTTNTLIECLSLFEKKSPRAYETLSSLREYQTNLIENLMGFAQKKTLLDALYDDLDGIEKTARSLLDDPLRAWIQGFGEVWSARLLCALLNQENMSAVQCDSRLFLRAQRSVMPEVDFLASLPLLQDQLLLCGKKRVVITGFMAQNAQGETVLLGRNGSDYSATVIGALAQVSCVTIWSDVAGVYSADPRIVPQSTLLSRIHIDEAAELARLGASVLHTRTLQPVAGSCIDLNLRCSYAPQAGSTRIERIESGDCGAKIMTSVDSVCLLDLCVSNEIDFSNTYQDIDAFLMQKQLQPLASCISEEERRIQLVYTLEMVSSVLHHLQNAAMAVEMRLREGYSMIAAVGAGVTLNAAHCHAFYQQLSGQPIEFICESKNGLSILVILRKINTQHLVMRMHQALFHVKPPVDLLSVGYSCRL